MYLPRKLIDHLYRQLLTRHHSLSAPVLILVALDPDALCACRILTALFKRDFIAHKIQPIAGYDDLNRAGETLVGKMRRQNGGDGGLVVCLGVGGLIDLSAMFGLDGEDDTDDPAGGVELWLIDARRPWNLANIFGGDPTSTQEGRADNSLTSRQARTVEKGMILSTYRPEKGGVITYDDGDIELELVKVKEAYNGLLEMGEVAADDDDDDDDDDESDAENDMAESTTEGGDDDEASSHSNKRKKSQSLLDDGMDDEEALQDDTDRLSRRKRRRSGSRSSNSPSADEDEEALFSPRPDNLSEEMSQQAMRKRFRRERRRFNSILRKYYAQGTYYAEPISSILYSLAEELGREENGLLWHAIVGVSSLELYGRSMTGVGISPALEIGGSAGWGGDRGERIRQALRDEVQRLNPPHLDESATGINPSSSSSSASVIMARRESGNSIPTAARSPTDHAIRLSPEPRFLLIRHWSLYESMQHSPYLGARLHMWSEQGRKRLHKFLAKMGLSLSECKQNYTHMDMQLKRGLRQSLLSFAPMYGLDGLVPPNSQGKEGWGFVKCWGWRGCFSAVDVAVIVGAILEVGKHTVSPTTLSLISSSSYNDHSPKDVPMTSNTTSHSTTTNNTHSHQNQSNTDPDSTSDEWIQRFWQAYDALENVDALKQALPTAQHLHRAILRTGTAVIEKRQIRHLKAFRMAVVKEGPDVSLFTHPSALTKLALWVSEAIAEQERDQRGRVGKGGIPTPLVMASLHEVRGVYIVVGTGGGGGVIDFAARARRKVRAQERAQAKTDRAESRRAEKVKAKERLRQQRAELGEDPDADDGLVSEEDEEEEEEEDDDDDNEDEENARVDSKNRFGTAFQEVVDETNARVRIDSFEHCVVEVKKEDLSGFLESLSMKAVVG